MPILICGRTHIQWQLHKSRHIYITFGDFCIALRVPYKRHSAYKGTAKQSYHHVQNESNPLTTAGKNLTPVGHPPQLTTESPEYL